MPVIGQFPKGRWVKVEPFDEEKWAERVAHIVKLMAEDLREDNEKAERSEK